MISGIAKPKDCLFVELPEASDGAPWHIHYNGVHANDVGHLVVAAKIFQVLVSSFLGLSNHAKATKKENPRWRDESVLKSGYGF